MSSRSPSPSPLAAPIVVAVDGSATSHRAVAWAAVEATLHHRRLHLLTSAAIPTGFAPAIDFDSEQFYWLRDLGNRTLTGATAIARKAAPSDDLEITTEVTLEPIIAELISRSRHAHMLVLGSHGHSAFRRGLLGSVSTAAAHHAHCPVAIVHSSSAIDPISARRPVLVGVDGTPNSVPTLTIAFEEAARRKVELIALHAWNDTGRTDLPARNWEALREAEHAALAESLAGWSEKYPDVPVRRIVTCDRPARALLDEAENAQLIVVGSHGRGGFTGMLLGSTSNTVLHMAECAIIVVRQPLQH
ncbi:universal stress protein [Nocardia sp. CDC159]|uniref:Universal stress protein n=1 Tax=Nocardia pulmonis TaxID=2951408 RepID=A0A9X2J1J9_9NOCA|nr:MULTISPECIES: universal stress protein [Nocardia]MCM6778959.1 universal stress protein [Nocardia pulmonis]MCM6791848.1 universal stress protein [Nocardia sp. CDC159]